MCNFVWKTRGNPDDDLIKLKKTKKQQCGFKKQVKYKHSFSFCIMCNVVQQANKFTLTDNNDNDNTENLLSWKKQTCFLLNYCINN